jgi:hypothetical protein
MLARAQGKGGPSDRRTTDGLALPASESRRAGLGRGASSTAVRSRDPRPGGCVDAEGGAEGRDAPTRRLAPAPQRPRALLSAAAPRPPEGPRRTARRRRRQLSPGARRARPPAPAVADPRGVVPRGALRRGAVDDERGPPASRRVRSAADVGGHRDVLRDGCWIRATGPPSAADRVELSQQVGGVRGQYILPCCCILPETATTRRRRRSDRKASFPRSWSRASTHMSGGETMRPRSAGSRWTPAWSRSGRSLQQRRCWRQSRPAGARPASFS